MTNQEIHAYAVALKQDQIVRLNFLERGADVAAVFVKVAGEQKASAVANSGSGFSRESLTLAADEEGVYLMVIRCQRVTDADRAAMYEFTASLDTVSDNNRQRMRAEAMLEEATQLIGTNDTEKIPAAIAKLEDAFALWNVLGDSYWAGVTRIGIGNSYLKLSKFEDAESSLDRMLPLFERLDSKAEVAAIVSGLALTAFARGDEPKGAAFLERARQLFTAIGDKRSLDLINALGLRTLASVVGKPAAPEFEKQLAEARAKKDATLEASIWAKTVFFFAMDDGFEDSKRSDIFARAEREALPLLPKITDRSIEAQLLLGLGMGYTDLSGEEDEEEAAAASKAVDYMGRALVISKSLKNSMYEAFAYSGLALIHEDKPEIFFGKKALNSLHAFRHSLKMLDIETQQLLAKSSGEWYEGLASDLAYEGRFQEAHQVLNLGRDQEFFDLKLIDDQPASKLALSDREAASERLFEAALMRIVETYTARPNDSQALSKEFAEALKQVKQSFSGDGSDKDVVKNIPDTIEMQGILRELSNKTGRQHAALYAGSDSAVLLVTADTIKGFGIRNVIAESSAYADALYKELIAQARAGTITQEQALAKGNEVKEKQRRRMDELLAEQTDDNLIGEFLDVLRSPDHDPRPLGAILYRRIFKKTELASGSGNTLEAELGRLGNPVLLLSLAGPIRYIPMPALYDEENKQYVVEKYETAIFTRAKKERLLPEIKPWNLGLGFGTSRAVGEFLPLPGVTGELSAIFGDPASGDKGFFSGEKYLNAGFTKTAFLSIAQKKPSFVHIASHFAFQPGDAKNSFLLLGDGGKFSLVDMRQNSNLFDGVDLLTLSACETAAQQEDADGKEIDGFAELAQRLGARSVMASLWKVSDKGTSKLMIEFYRLHRQNPGAPKAATLRQAQLDLLRRRVTASAATKGSATGAPAHRTGTKPTVPFQPASPNSLEHPYYWAPFVLFGSPNGEKVMK